MSTITLENEILSRIKGISMAVAGAAMWGISGTVAQVLFQQGMSPEWLVTIRLIVAGGLLLGYSSWRIGTEKTWGVWKAKEDRLPLLLFGLLGMLGVQYTYFAAISAGNAATATLLQFLGPVFIVLFLSLRYLRLPSGLEIVALFLALLGTFLLVTKGSMSGLAISLKAVVWGIAAALTAAFYTLYPAKLLKKWGAMSVVGWGMLIGGVGMSFVSYPWNVASFHYTWSAWFGIGFVVVFGTLVPFYFVLESLRFISPSEVGMLNSAEPLSAVIVSVIWLHLTLGLVESLGGLCIVATVIVLAVNQRQRKSIK